MGVVAINSNDFEHYADDSPAKMKEEIAARRLYVPLSRRRNPAGRQGLSGRLHARFLSLRRRSEAGLSRPDGRQPSRQQSARHRQGSPRRPRRRSGREARIEGTAAEHRLQHQVATRERTPVFLLNHPANSGVTSLESHRPHVRGRAIRRRPGGRGDRNPASNR